MATLKMTAVPSFKNVTSELLSRVSLDLFDNDQMYKGNDKHYLSVGASGLNVIESARGLAFESPVVDVLDFGVGAGRVARWLRAAYPTARIVGADLRERDLAFCRETFDIVPWATTTDIKSLEPHGSFDVIWAGSVITHLPEHATKLLLAKFADWLKPNGICVVSMHGPYAYQRMKGGRGYGLSADGEAFALNGYDLSGYGYQDYPSQSGYGISINTPAWAVSAISCMPEYRVVTYSEQAFDGHQDVLAFQRKSA